MKKRYPVHYIPFTKMQALGNDFVLVDCLEQVYSLTPDNICQMADRHWGIGFDQLLCLHPAPYPGVDFGYQIFNADGSEVAQCGNGARCLGYYIHKNGLTQQSSIRIATQARQLTLQIDPNVDSNQQVSVDMGVPTFEPQSIPFITALSESGQSKRKNPDTMQSHVQLDVKHQLDFESPVGKVWVSVVGLGNPHAIMIVKSVDAAPVTTWGPIIQRHPQFPQQVNVGFMEVVGRSHIRLRVYERGAGETLGCGSGACAAVVAGHLLGELDNQVLVSLPGGELKIYWEGLSSPVQMTGEAYEVFKGQWPIMANAV